MATNIPQSIDYTSRDFYSLRDDLITRVKDRLAAAGKTWNGTDPSDFGVAILEAFAHVGDVTSYYIDRVANEGYLATATQRQSLLNLAELYGYTPSGYRRASVELSFSNPDTENIVTIPEGTQVGVDIVSTNGTYSSVTKVIFTLDSEVLVPAAVDETTAGTATGLAFHGYNVSSLATNAADPLDPIDFPGEILGSSNGFAEQAFVLSSNRVADGTVEVYVNTGNTYNLWTEVLHLSDYGPTDPVYTLTTDANNNVTVTFGDGVSGAIPSVGATVKATYVIGGGEEGNLKGGNIFNFIYVPASSGLSVSEFSDVTVSNSSNNPASGGEEPETNDSIRLNAPLAFRTMSRAVTLDDFSGLAISVANVGKAKAYASAPTSIVMYISKQVSDVSSDYYPGYDATNTNVRDEWYTLQESVANFMSNKTQIGTTVTYLPPVYVPVIISIEYSKYEGYTDDQINQAIKYAIVYGYGYNFIDFDAIIYPEQIEGLLASLPGVKTARVTELYRDGDSPDRVVLVPQQGELFVFEDGNTNVFPIAALSALSISSGTLSPTFESSVLSYRVTDTSTTTVTVTPTSWSGTASFVNGSSVNSGSASGTISTPSGQTTTITVAHDSSDGVNTATYTITVIR